MIVLFVTLAEADDLQNLLRRAGFMSLLRQMAVQLPLERVLPEDALPILSIRYGGGEGMTEDIYDETIAQAMYEAMHAAFRTTKATA